MKNLLSLHEAIIIALININKETFTASFDEIADYIESRNLYPERRGNVNLATQIMLRTTKSKDNYSYLFTRINEKQIKIKC